MSDEMKKAAGYAAADFIENGMLVGLGTGSTVFYFINRLIERTKEGLSIQAVSSSIQSENQAKEGGISLADINAITSVDLTVDGADEINGEKQMIKGGGGALLREKVLANISREMVVIVDKSKVVEKLGKHPLAVEILPFAREAIIEKIRKLGFYGTLREHNKDGPFITDNGNMIYDIHFESLREDPEKDHEKILRIPGVLETGFFFNQAGRVIIGKEDGTVDHWS
ncbi:MAG: ribose-5-phosphate isomerase RpiA [Simkaniaceae bacterium]|nr:MAG: ribose-5-phosphate isomerase RpiA [Simkaniaceae bacterium]